MSWPLSTQSVGACLFGGGTPLRFVQDVGIGKNTTLPLHPKPISCAKYALGIVTCCRTLRSSTLHPVILVRVHSVRGPHRPGAHGLRSVGSGCRAVLRGWVLRVEDCAGSVRVWRHRPPGCPRCCLSDSAAQHRERGGALVPPRSSQSTLHAIKPHSRRSSCAPTRVRRRVVSGASLPVLYCTWYS